MKKKLTKISAVLMMLILIAASAAFPVKAVADGSNSQTSGFTVEIILDDAASDSAYDDTYQKNYGKVQYTYDNNTWYDISASSDNVTISKGDNGNGRLKYTLVVNDNSVKIKCSAVSGKRAVSSGAQLSGDGEITFTSGAETHIEFKDDAGQGGQNPPVQGNHIDIRVDGLTDDNAKVQYKLKNASAWEELAAGMKSIQYTEGDVYVVKVTYDESKYMVQNPDGLLSADGVLKNGTEYEIKNSGEYTIQIDRKVNTVTWNSDDRLGEDAKVSHGTVEILSAVKPGETGQWSGLTQVEGNNSQNNKEGRVVIEPGSIVTVKLTPEYGYQFVSGSLNGNTVTAGSDISTFTFTMPDTNLHLSAVFAKTDDICSVQADGIGSASIAGGASVIASGNLRLTVKDSGLTDVQKATIGNSSAGQGVTFTNWVELDLEQVVNKGNTTDVWANKLEELNNKVTITLNVGTALDASKEYVVVREHKGEYEKLPATYNKDEGTLTFQSDRFSEYAIGTVEKSSEITTGGDTTGQQSEDATKTGDSNVIYYISIMMLAAGAALIVSLKKLQKL